MNDELINSLYESIRGLINNTIDLSTVTTIMVSMNLRSIVINALIDDPYFEMDEYTLRWHYNGVLVMFRTHMPENIIRFIYERTHKRDYDLSEGYDRAFGIQFSAELFDKII